LKLNLNFSHASHPNQTKHFGLSVQNILQTHKDEKSVKFKKFIIGNDPGNYI